MGARFRHLRFDERGLSYAFVGVSFMTVFTATTLAIDVGVYTAARNQAQRSAQAGALAGAAALALSSDSNQAPVAVQRALEGAKANSVMGIQVSIQSSDVIVATDVGGQSRQVKVSVYRTSERHNPVRTAMSTVFGLDPIDVRATATAEVLPLSPVDGGDDVTNENGGPAPLAAFPNVIRLVQ
jgi:3D (Asp-Asp-Asp) domain-containing protein